MARFSDVLFNLRKRENLTQSELADKLTAIGEAKITRSAVGMWEAGKRVPKLEVLETIADFFNINLDTLTGVSSVNLFGPADELGMAKTEIISQLADMDAEELALLLRNIDKIKAARMDD